MVETRYSGKEELAQYDLSLQLFSKFNLNIKDVVPLRNVYILRTDKGDKILKKIDYSIDELDFIYSAIKYIKSSFDRVVDFVKTEDEQLYVNWNKDIYCLMDVIVGRECEFNNPVDVAIASRGLGELHKASEGFRYNMAGKISFGKLIDRFRRRMEEVKFFKNIVNLNDNKNEFDEMFIENVDYYLDKMKQSIEFMEKTQYYKLCSEEDKIVLCHHDLAHHNIIINDDKAYFIDFDYSVLDLKVHDLCNFINKAIKNVAFDFEKCQLIYDEYCYYSNNTN